VKDERSLTGPKDESEVQITYIRSKNGRRRKLPVWFTLNQGRMELLPMHGEKTKWFVDVEKSGKIELEVSGWKKEAKPKTVRDSGRVDEIKGRFSAKYGAGDVRRYYPTSEVALEIPL
jgi:hypothetical protein